MMPFGISPKAIADDEEEPVSDQDPNQKTPYCCLKKKELELKP